MADAPVVFVAYPYAAFSEADYRGAFDDVAAEFGVAFMYADERITNRHILEKIEGMMRDAAFSLFDITAWNANVSLELGIAIGEGLDYYVLFNPTVAGGEVPADLGGIDRIQYRDFAGLKEGLGRLMIQQFGPPEPEAERTPAASELGDILDALRVRVPEIVREEPGLLIGGIAEALGIEVEFARAVVKPLIGDPLVPRGERRGTRYYLPENEPPLDEATIRRHLPSLPPELVNRLIEDGATSESLKRLHWWKIAGDEEND